MSVLIKGMDMPKDCRTCQLKMNCTDCEGWDCSCLPIGKEIGGIDELPKDKRRKDCPLVEVPTPHGSLIDRDAIVLNYSGLAHISPLDFMGTAKHFADQIEKMKPVIEAEE